MSLKRISYDIPKIPSFPPQSTHKEIISKLNSQSLKNNFKKLDQISLSILVEQFEAKSAFMISKLATHHSIINFSEEQFTSIKPNTIKSKCFENISSEILSLTKDDNNKYDDDNDEIILFFSDLSMICEQKVPNDFCPKNCVCYPLKKKNNDSIFCIISGLDKIVFNHLKKFCNDTFNLFFESLYTLSHLEITQTRFEKTKGVTEKFISKTSPHIFITLDRERLKVKKTTKNFSKITGQGDKIVNHKLHHLFQYPKKKDLLNYLCEGWQENNTPINIKFHSNSREMKLMCLGTNHENNYELIIYQENSSPPEEENRDRKTPPNIDFVTNIIEEIRNPLNAIISLIPILTQSKLPQEQLEQIKIIQQSSFGIVSIINDIFDIAKLEQNKLSLREEEMSLLDCINDSMAIVEEKANSKSLSLRKKIVTDIPKTISGDNDRIRQILVNILTNAIKFTDEGHIEVEVYCNNTISGVDIKIIISDTGIGIPPEYRKLIFKPYFKVPSDRGDHGVGLGLSISKKIVKLMPEGRLYLKSREKGSSFIIEFSSPEIDTLKLCTEHSDVLSSIKILVVDCDVENRLFFSSLFTTWGVDVVLVSTRVEFEELYLKNVERFDCVLVGYMLSETDCISIAKEIKGKTDSVQLMLVGGYLKSNLFSNSIAKPFNEKRLLALILSIRGVNDSRIKFFTLSNRKKSSPYIKRKFNPKNKWILVADSDRTNEMVLDNLLRNLGYIHVVFESNNDKILELCQRPDVHFDLIFLDPKISTKNGLEISRSITEIYSSRRLERPSIIALAHIESTKLIEYIDNGYIDDYLTKPISVDRLKKKINKFLNQSMHRRVVSSSI